MKKDISTPSDIDFLVEAFYKKAMEDELIKHFFIDVAEINLETHLPVISQFWKSTLLGEVGYKGNPMVKHIQMHQKSPMKRDHFEQWLFLWTETINQHFLGKKAEEAKTRARAMMDLMLYKMGKSESSNHIL